MMKLRDFLTIKGRVSADELIAHCGYEFVPELQQMIKDMEVSVHTENLGGLWYRYPHYSPKVLGNPGRKGEILDLVKKNPGINASRIRTVLGMSQSSFERWEAELMGSGQLSRTKKGVAWLYSAPEVETVKTEETEELDTTEIFMMFREMLSGVESTQALAKSQQMSRDLVNKYKGWLVEKGFEVEEFKKLSVDEMKEKLQIFERVHERWIKELLSKNSNLYPPSTNEPKPWANMEELSQAILEEVGEDGIPFRELRRRLSRSTGAGTPYRTWEMSHLESLGPTLQKMGVVFFDGEDGKFDPEDPTTCWVSLE